MLFPVSQRKGVWPSHGGDHEECRGWSTGSWGQLGSVTSCSAQAGVGLATKWEWCRPWRPRTACRGSSWSGGQAEKTSQHLPPLSGPPRNLGAGSLEGTRL